MKHRILLLLTVLFISSLAWSQSVKISGKVVDSIGQPLAMANVIAYQKDKNLGAFGITNDNGNYQLLDLKRDSTYIIKVSYLGLKTTEDTIKNIQTDLVKNYVLLEGADQLDAVNIVYEMPVSIKGDTIIYNSDSFTNGTERRLGEVLQKLPGVEVNEDGDVEVEGKRVEKLMVNGKDFFEGDTRLGTKNIPANAVDKVEVLRNYNNVNQLKGLGNDQDRIAINIRLKEGKENFWFGDGTAAVGYGGQDERYLIQPKAFYYSEKLSINVLTDMNNLGEPAFTARDYFRFVGFRRGNTQATNGRIGVGAASSFNPIAVSAATNVETKFAAINSIWNASNSLDVKTFVIFNQANTDAFSQNINRFIDSGLEEIRSSGNTEEVQSTIFKLGADFKPNENLSLDYDGQFNVTNEESISNTISQSTRGTENISGAADQNPYTFDQSLNAYYTLGERNIFSLESRFLNQEEDPFSNAVRDLLGVEDPAPFNGIGLEDADPYNLNQDRTVRTNKLDAKVDYWYVINKKSNINLYTGTTVTNQNFDSNIFQILNDGTINNLDALGVGNEDVNFDYRNVFFGARYKMVQDKWTFTPGLEAHSFQAKTFQNNAESTINTEHILPTVNVRYDFRSSQTLNFDYNQTVTFNDIDAYAEGLVLQGFNGLTAGNSELTGVLNDVVSLRYRDFNMFNYQNINASITYTRTREALQSELDLDEINTVSRRINSPFTNESFNANAGYSREVKKVNVGYRGSYSFSNFNNRINGEDLESINQNHSHRFTARSNFQNGVNFNLGYNVIFANNDNGGLITNSTRNIYSIDLDWQIGKRWFIRGEYDFNKFSTEGQENEFDFLDAVIRYRKPKSNWEYSLIGSNLLDRDARITNNFGQITNSISSTFVLPRYIYFRVQYDL